MKKTLALAATAIVTSTAAFADEAMDQAIAGKYCSEARPVAAEFLADGRLQVTCPAGALAGETSALSAGGLASGQGLGLALGGVAIVIAAGGGDGSTTTTTTTTTTGGS